MSNKYDKILGKYRENDISFSGSSVYVPYTGATTNVDLGVRTLTAAYIRAYDPIDMAEFFGNRMTLTSATNGTFGVNMGGDMAEYGKTWNAGLPYCWSSHQASALFDISEVASMKNYRAVGTYWAYDGEMEPYEVTVESFYGPLQMDLSAAADFIINRGGVQVGSFTGSTFDWANTLHAASGHAFSAGDFTVFEFGNDSLAAFNSTPFRLWWDDSNGYLTWDDGGSGLLYLRANLSADYLTGIISSLGTITGTSAALTPVANTTTVPLTVQGASAASNIGVTFTYAAAQTFTVTIASPGVLTTASPHGLTADHMVRLSTTGALPTGLGTTTLYYVRNPSGSNLELSLTAGGASINTSGTQSGTHTITPLCKCATISPHGRAANDPVFFAGGTPMPTGLTAGTTYYVGAGGLTSSEFYPKTNTPSGVAQYVAITSSGGGAPYVYGQNSDHFRAYNSAGSSMYAIDKWGNITGNMTTTAWRLGVIPADTTFSGLWIGSSAFSPSASNYTLLGDASNSFINGPTYCYLRTGNTNRVQISSSGLLIYDAHNIALQTTTGTKIGTATNEKLAFHNSTPVIQRAGAAQAAVATTASTNAAPYGYTTSAQADAIVTLVNEIRATLVEKGLMKGAA